MGPRMKLPVVALAFLALCLASGADSRQLSATCAAAPSSIISPARLEILCALGGAAAAAPACTLQRLCSASGTSAGPTPAIFPSLCNVTKLASSLCVDATLSKTIPECQQ